MAKSNPLTLSDHFAPSLWPLFRLKLAFLYPDGIFSPLERLVKKGHSPEEIRFLHGPHRTFWGPLLNSADFLREPEAIADGEEITGPRILQEFPKKLEEDLNFLSEENFQRHNFSFSHSGKEIFVHRTAQIHPYVHMDATEGPVVIDAHCKISAFCLLRGPLYVAEGAILDRVSLSHSRIGKACRLGGEISHSFFGDFSNKHHEGFVGHSLVGDWVNLGALTTTSDLKNNYGEVRLSFRNIRESTGTIKFGSIIGDFTKTAIGTMLTTGTVIDFGCLLYEGRPLLKYYPPFFWGGAEATVYQIDRFISDAKKIMARRQKSLSPWQEQAIRDLYENEIKKKANLPF